MKQKNEGLALDRALAQLPPEQASEHFTERVLEGLEHRRPSMLGASPPRLVGAMAALAAMGLGLGLWLRSPSPIETKAREKSPQQLRLEYQNLQEEVAALRSMAAVPPPVLYLGGNSRIDLVLDLGQSDSDVTSRDIRPAATRSGQAEPERQPNR